MKKMISMLLTVLLLIALPTNSVFASETISGTADIIANGTVTTDSDTAPDPFYPFVYDEERNYAWLGQTLEQKIAELTPGYLYIANMETNDVLEIMAEPVDSIQCSSQYIYAKTADQVIVRLNYSGQGYTVLYESISGVLDALEYENYLLYFADGSSVIQMDTRTGTTSVLLEKEGVTDILPYKAGHLMLTNEQGQRFAYSINGQQLCILSSDEEVDALLNTAVVNVPPALELTWILPEADASIQALADTYVSLPMSGYPAGSYFTTTGAACSNHNRCKYYASTRQCDGFARYVNEHYYHVPGSTWSAPYAVSGDKTSSYSKYQAFGSTTALYQFFNQLETGAYVRVSSRDRVADNTDPHTGQGSHSFVYISHDRNGATLYEANLDNKCGVSYSYRDFDELLRRYPYFFGWVNHDREGAVTNSSDLYHRINCSHSGCAAYIVEVHTYAASGTGYECVACGDFTTDPQGPIIMD